MKRREAAKKKNIPKKHSKKKRNIDSLKPVCWLIIPVIIALFIVLDAFEIYIFTKERLIVIGGCLLVVLLPFFSEITIKELSVKRDKRKNENT